MWPSIDLKNQENIIIFFQIVIKVKKLEGSFVKNITTKIVPHNILISINILFALFSYSFANFARFLRNLCVQIFSMPGATSLPLIYFAKQSNRYQDNDI